MPLFRLEQYPHVCRLCLRPEESRRMTSLDTEDECFEGASFEDFLARITFEVEEEKRHLFPRSICPTCKNLLQAFGSFYAKVRRVHLFMNALVELRDMNMKPLRSLFAKRSKRRSTRAMLLELDLCQSDRVGANDLIEEFPQFKIASLPAVVRRGWVDVGVKKDEKVEVERPAPETDEDTISQDEVEKGEQDRVDLEDLEEGALFAEECSPEELKELTNAVKADPGALQEISDEPDVKWEFLDDTDEEMEVPKKVLARRKTATMKKKPKPKPRPKRIIDYDNLIANLPTTFEGLKERLSTLPKHFGGVKAAEPIQCPKCPYKAIYKLSYHRHQLTHLKRELFRFMCKEPGCSAQFHDRRYLAAHVEKMHRFWICEMCGQQCGSRNNLHLHKLRNHAENPPSYSCEYCPRSFKINSDLRNHVRNIHLAESAYKCDTCGLEFRRKTTLDNHKLSHTQVYNSACLQCDKKFKDKKALRKHTLRAHQEPGFECEHCSKQFYTRYTLMDHIESAHQIQMRFVCDICVAVFDSQDKLVTHRDSHDNPKMNQCGRCLLVSSAQEPGFEHLCITYRDDYVCCDRDFKDYGPYNRHVFLRHGTKVNARVRPEPGVLIGQMRARRKRMEICQKCDACFPNRLLKKQHQETCLAGDIQF